jgi:hypothetical protein
MEDLGQLEQLGLPRVVRDQRDRRGCRSRARLRLHTGLGEHGPQARRVGLADVILS